MVKALFETTILIDYLNAISQARDELNRYEERAISIITWMEVMVGTEGRLETPTRAFLDGFEVIGLDARVAERAVVLRRDRRVKLPDAVIWASAQVNGMLLVTRNSKDFPVDDPSVRMPYGLSH
ncbi:twitching motility protein PilT [Skermanella stibiiresistens SB22]|uniref:Twitching motility protein PilT n=1 Tax=Skermanella stibiiresistens SB22 TaxID=1385369 RepID=W9GWI6_9PROT|nr:type II toxin-antitoxin system VapC family toxin [Skermanella stibiiresistens]EWY38144.1 twitching motility protein PilT [Skermanella stibiiresistens SB22]